MKYITLQNTDLTVSNLCLGGGNFGDKLNKEEAFEILDSYVSQGGSFIDTANVYCRWVKGLGNSSEQMLGEWLKSRNAYKEVSIATKGGHYNLDTPNISRITKADIKADLEESQKTLGLETIDFYWLHRDNEEKSMEEIIDILEELKQEGHIRYYGLSNYKTERLIEGEKYLESKGKKGIFGVSNRWSLAGISEEVKSTGDKTLVTYGEKEEEWHKRTGVPMIPYSSTAFGFFEKLKESKAIIKNGDVTERGMLDHIPANIIKAYLNKENLLMYEKLLFLQDKTGHSLQALSLAYLLNQPFQVVPIGSVRNLNQLKGFLEASEIEVDIKEYR